MAGSVAVLLVVVSAAAAASLTDLSRRDTGDVFTLFGEKCGPSVCSEHGAGVSGVGPADGGCACACPQRAPLFREDRELCVDDLPECSLATFGTGGGVQRIPFVYLPLKGQIIHPSRDIVFPNVKTPICAVSGAQFLTRKGFLDLRNTLDADVPFSLFRDEGRTFLQWTGEEEVRARMSGRVMVVRLLCRDVAALPASPLDLRGVFTPCVAFRVQGAPPRYSNNITEVLFTPNAQTSETNSTGLSVTEYVAIGISSLLLGLIYVASVFLYLHIKKRRKNTAENNNNRILKSFKVNDVLPITERDIIRITHERVQNLPTTIGPDAGVIKKNPLLSVGRFYYDNTNIPSNLSQCDDLESSRNDGKGFKNSTISAVIHQRVEDNRHEGVEFTHREEPNMERLPDEHVSIVETTDEREIARPVGTTRRKLYFNPAYFEPHLMADPPPAALEFLTKIREVISIAKQKMAAKRFLPNLNEIPEEETYPSNENSIDYYNRESQRSGSIISLKRENSRKRSVSCLGCPGCQSKGSKGSQNTLPLNQLSCNNCRHTKGDIQSSIRKWLENIPNEKPTLPYNENTLASSLLSLPLNINNYNMQNQDNYHNYSSLNDFIVPRRTRSVSSEPASKNYNIPLPEFKCTKSTNTLNRCEANAQFINLSPMLQSGCYGSSRKETVNSDNNKGIIKTGLKNKNILPDMVNEAIALDNFSKSLYNLSSSDERLYVANNITNDYETDSLERTSNKKDKGVTGDFTEIASSQASPSLSTALPLEEELTITNDVYKINSSNSDTPSPNGHMCVEQNHYEIIDGPKSSTQNDARVDCSTFKQNSDYNLVSEVYVNNNYDFDSAPTSPSGSECSMGSRKLHVLNNLKQKRGSLTIEVRDPPENYIKIHESDGFEPDTLDRKYTKQKVLESVQIKRIVDLKNNNDDISDTEKQYTLGNTGTFTKHTQKNDTFKRFSSMRNIQDHKHLNNCQTVSTAVRSGSKSLENTGDDAWDDSFDWASEEGRILTLEHRHSKRQRQCTPPTIKQIKSLARPDILPPLPPTGCSPIYEKPTNPPRRIDTTDFQQTTKENMITKNEPISCTTSSYSSLQGIPNSLHSEYEDTQQTNTYSNDDMKEFDKTDDYSSSNEKTLDSGFLSNRINTNTFVKGSRIDNSTRTKLRRKNGVNIHDSGYLSGDSTCSKQINMKSLHNKLVVAKVISCSESDYSENDARSESGAESVETHSVYFGSNYRRGSSDANYVRVKSAREKRKYKSRIENV